MKNILQDMNFTGQLSVCIIKNGINIYLKAVFIGDMKKSYIFESIIISDDMLSFYFRYVKLKPTGTCITIRIKLYSMSKLPLKSLKVLPRLP